jgi:hypothetical protein
MILSKKISRNCLLKKKIFCVEEFMRFLGWRKWEDSLMVVVAGRRWRIGEWILYISGFDSYIQNLGFSCVGYRNI